MGDKDDKAKKEEEELVKFWTKKVSIIDQLFASELDPWVNLTRKYQKTKDPKLKTELEKKYSVLPKLFEKKSVQLNADIEAALKKFKHLEDPERPRKQLEKLYKSMTVHKFGKDKSLEIKIKDPRKPPTINLKFEF